MTISFNFLDQLLDLNSEKLASLKEAKNKFNWNQSLNYIKGLSCYLPDNENDKVLEIFNRLKYYFEIGILLEKKQSIDTSNLSSTMGLNQWVPKIFFAYETHQQSASLNAIALSLPKFNLFRINKFSSNAILKKLNITNLDSENKMTTIAIQISETQVYCLLTEQADPWLSLRLELILKEIKNGLL